YHEFSVGSSNLHLKMLKIALRIDGLKQKTGLELLAARGAPVPCARRRRLQNEAFASVGSARRARLLR
ncbi:hypothetical protein A2U01_0069861, partial [Trifolium medium]|nr:hypothetical protein [Trifolium medium]